jgi:hypothetical protein
MRGRAGQIAASAKPTVRGGDWPVAPVGLRLAPRIFTLFLKSGQIGRRETNYQEIELFRLREN